MPNAEIKEIERRINGKFVKLLNGSCFGIKTTTQSKTIKVRMISRLLGFQYRTGLEHQKITGRTCNYNTVIWK